MVGGVFDIRASWGRGFAHGPLEDLQDALRGYCSGLIGY